MKILPLNALSNVQKGLLLYSLQISEIPQFIKYINSQSKLIIHQKEKTKGSWTNPMFDVNLWLELADECCNNTEAHAKDLTNRGRIFSQRLFTGYGGIFTIHHLIQYCNEPDCNHKFKQAVEFLFT
jgi:hypothetical protein